ncbi:MAG TPA: serine/threonine-protein kinase, partial [Candidatus Melainabacteria bacterium]|nr:serine/threonine-protein kinase [Candidatus Melainabacteria bacterium]
TVVEAVAGAASGQSESSSHYLLLDTIQKNVYQLRWENAFAWVDEEEFFSIVRSSASHARMNFGIEEVHRPDKLDTRYTNLWLHYFSAPTNRQRRGKLDPGEQLQDGSYEIVESLSGGGQGTAYLAKVDRNKGNLDSIPDGIDQVVLKEYVMPVYRGNKLEKRKYDELSEEAKMLSGLDHERIVKLYDCFVEDHRGYLVLEYISGFPLSRLVKEKGVMTPEAVAAIALDVTGILTYLHDRDRPIVHRDLTPDNLMLDESSRSVKLLDFTVARESSVQRTATIVGKQSYMPPEQFRGAACPASDIYALSCTMFYLLTGLDPKPMEMEPVSAYREDADDGLDAIIMKAGAFELEERYLSAADMAVDLKSWFRARQEF